MKASGTHPGKVLVVEIGTNEHDRSAQAVAARLRDGGMEVVFTGRLVAADALARSALEEDVDLIVLCGIGPTLLPTGEIIMALDQAGLQHVGLVAAGTEPRALTGFAAVIDANIPDENSLHRLRSLAAQCRAKRGGPR